MMETTAGFYSITPNRELLHAPNSVHGPGFDLYSDQKDSYTYPAHGWIWYDSIQQARQANGISEPEPEEPAPVDMYLVAPIPE